MQRRLLCVPAMAIGGAAASFADKNSSQFSLSGVTL
jgi:hypothetical protein